MDGRDARARRAGEESQVGIDECRVEPAVEPESEMGDREQLDAAAGACRKADLAVGAFGGIAREAEHASQERPTRPPENSRRPPACM